MKLEKAIEILTDITHAHASARTPDSIASIQLGIEALQRLQQSRVGHAWTNISKLPGETKE